MLSETEGEILMMTIVAFIVICILPVMFFLLLMAQWINASNKAVKVLEQRRAGTWEVVPAKESIEGTAHDIIIGYLVRWSVPDNGGRYLNVRHYYAGLEGNEPTIEWCQHAAERDCRRMIEDGRHPREWGRA